MEAKILLDTNFLLIPGEFGVDIFSELERVMDRKYRLFVLSKTLDELRNIQAMQAGKNKKAASIALQLIETKGLNIIEAAKPADDAIVEIADSSYIVGTQDRQLRQRLREKGIKLLTLRSKKHLIIT
ncbi:nucleotide-binding protein [Candidatus Woesearchaeota archaeon]|nr:nucleotide-binding protein [Candidatus Woesearchaeota archaeon]